MRCSRKAAIRKKEKQHLSESNQSKPGTCRVFLILENIAYCMYKKAKKGRKEMLTTLNSPEGAVFYFEKGVYGYTCKNLDVPESATTLTFIDESHTYSGSGYLLKNVMK